MIMWVMVARIKWGNQKRKKGSNLHADECTALGGGTEDRYDVVA